MNRIYRLVWSESRCAFVPVSELSPARRQRKTHGAVAPIARVLLLNCLCLGAMGYHVTAHAQSSDDRKLDDLQALVAKYEHPASTAIAVAAPGAAAAAPPALAALPGPAAATGRVATVVRASAGGMKMRAVARAIAVPVSALPANLPFDVVRPNAQSLLSQVAGVDLAAGQGRAAAVVTAGNEVADRQRPVVLATQLGTASALQEGHPDALQLGADGLVHIAAPNASAPAVDATAHAQVGIGGSELADVHVHAGVAVAPVLPRVDADLNVHLGAGVGGAVAGLPATVDGLNHTLNSAASAATAKTPLGGTVATVLQPVESSLHSVATTVSGVANGSGLGGVQGNGVGGIVSGLPTTVDGLDHTLNSVASAVTANTPLGGTVATVLQPVESSLHSVATTLAGATGSAGQGGVVLSGLTGTVDGINGTVNRVVGTATANTPLNGVAATVLPPVEGTLHNIVATVENKVNGTGLGGVIGSVGNGGLGGNATSPIPAMADGVTGTVTGIVGAATARTPLAGTVSAALQPVAGAVHGVVSTVADAGNGAGLGHALGGALSGGSAGGIGGNGGVVLAGLTGTVDGVTGAVNRIAGTATANTPLNGVAAAVLPPVEGTLHNVVATVENTANGTGLGGVLGSVGNGGLGGNATSSLPATVDGVTGTVGSIVGTATAGTPLAGTATSILQPVAGALHDVATTAAGTSSGSGLGNVLGGTGGGKLASDVGHTVNDTVAAVGNVLKTVGNGSNGGLLNVGSNLTPVTGDVVTTVNDVVGATTQTLGSTLGGSSGAGLLGSMPVLSNVMSSVSSPATSAMPQAVPVVPPPSATPTGLIVGNGGVIGTANTLLGTTENSLFNNTNGYVTNGGLQVNAANFTQGYATVNALGLPLVNLTPAGSVLTTTGGTTLGGTGINSHLTLIGAVKSDSYITNINNGAAGGIAGLLLPSSAPAWASTCLNVLGVVQEQCWAVNAAQDYQVLMGDGASANGSKEVVIGTNASHTLAAQTAASAFPGTGTNDPNNPTGVPTADYAARLGHSVVIGDDASGTANAQTIIGAEATASAANSVALGYQSSASRGAQTSYSAYGLIAPQTSAGEVSVGSAGKERQITNVAAGSAPTDAVNVAQLQGVAITAGNAVQYDDATRGTVTLAGTASTDGGATNGTLLTNLHQGAISVASTDAINGAQLWHWTQDTTNVYSNYSLYNAIKNISPINNPGGGVKYFAVNSTLADAAASGTNGVAVGPVASASGTNAVAVGNGATASANNSVAIGAGSVADRANTVSVGSAGNARQITNVAAGTAATDAVNLGQMQASINTSQQGTVRYDSNTDGSVNYGSVTLGNGSGATTVHNVASGVATTDAANVGQLNAGMQQATNWANAYTDQRVGQLNSQIQSVGHRADAGVAAGMAMAGLPQAYEPGRSMAAVSAGSFRGESSIAIGVSAISQGGRWVYKLSGSADTRGDAGVAIGAGMQW